MQPARHAPVKRHAPLLLLSLLDARAASSAPRPSANRAVVARSAWSAARASASPLARERAYRNSAARTSVRMSADPDLARHNPIFDRFLLQRAVQTHIVYLNELHDQPNARFVGHFLEHQGIDRYHGFDGLRVEPEDYIEKLLSSPPTTVQVRSSFGSVSWGGSPGNPYLSKREAKTHDFVVYPDRIGAALLRVRDHVAEELSADLDVLASADLSFWERRASGAQALPADGSSVVESSPTRRATFDLLQKLTLHVAIKQTLLALSRAQPKGARARSSEPSAPHQWLERKFAQSGFLCGDQGFGTSGAFLESLAQQESVLVRCDPAAEGEEGEGCAIVDPQAIANQILDARVLLARHYKNRLNDVHERGTDQLRNRLERSLRAQFRDQ